MKLVELLQALVEGKKLCMATWRSDAYISLGPDGLVDEKGAVYDGYEVFDTPEYFRLYTEPSIYLTPNHVGRRVRVRSGDICLVTAIWIYDNEVQYESGVHTWRQDGTSLTRPSYDIVEILPDKGTT